MSAKCLSGCWRIAHARIACDLYNIRHQNSLALFGQPSQLPRNILINPASHCCGCCCCCCCVTPAAPLSPLRPPPPSSSSALAIALVQARGTGGQQQINIRGLEFGFITLTCDALAGGSAGAAEDASRPKSSAAAAVRVAAVRVAAGADSGRVMRLIFAAGFAEDFEEDGRCCCA